MTILTSLTTLRTRRFGLVVIMAVACTFFAVPAAAHTELERSTPASGATVPEVAEVTLVFSEDVRLAKVKVVDATGTEFQSGAVRVAGDTVAQQVSDGMAAGEYTLAYRVVSTDGHPVEGTVPFKVAVSKGAANGAPDAAVQGAGSAERGRPSAANTTSDGGQKWLMVGAGLLAGMGIGFAIVFLRRGKDPRPSGD